MIARLFDIVEAPEAWETALTGWVFGFVGVVILTLWGRWYLGKHVTKREKAVKDAANTVKAELREYLGEHESTVINITGEDAKKQWPKIQRRLNRWEREVMERSDG